MTITGKNSITFTTQKYTITLGELTEMCSKASQAGAKANATVRINTYSGDQRDPRDSGHTTITFEWAIT